MEKPKSILEIKNRFRCGACDGAKCGHTLACQAIESCTSLLESVRMKKKELKYGIDILQQTREALDNLRAVGYNEAVKEVNNQIQFLLSEGEEGKTECVFESDGEKHSCISSCDGVVENCRKCFRDICSNKNCPLGKGK